MHPDQSTDKLSHGNNQTGRRVRSLLGLPDQAASLQGHGPLPPGAFRYQMQAGFEEPLTSTPFSQQSVDLSHGGEEDLSSRDNREEVSSALAPGESAQIARQMDSQGGDTGRPIKQQPAAPGTSPQAVHEDRPSQTAAQDREMKRTGPAAIQAHRPSISEAWQAVHHPGQMMPDEASIMPAARGAEEFQQASADSRPTAGPDKKAEHGSRQEIAIPGRSTVRQVFAALAAAADEEELAAADQSTTPMPQQPAPLSVNQPQLESAAVVHDAPSSPRQAGPEPMPSLAGREPRRTLGVLSPSPPMTGSAPQTTQITRAAATQTPRPVTVQGSQLLPGTADNSAEHDSSTHITSAKQETRTSLVSRQGQQHSASQAQVEPGTEKRNTSITPARRPDGDGARQIEELRRTFYELVSKKSSATGPKEEEPTMATEIETPSQPPLQQVVVINRTSGSRSRGRTPAAFWERSGMARTTLKMLR